MPTDRSEVTSEFSVPGGGGRESPGRSVWLRLAAVGVIAVALVAGLQLLADRSKEAPVPLAGEVATDSPAGSPESQGVVGAPAEVADSRSASVRRVRDDTWFLALPDDQRGLVILGIDPEKYSSLLAYFDELEHRVSAGDYTIALTLARFYFSCRLKLGNPDILATPGHPSHLTAKLCTTLPERPASYEQELVAEAAMRGVEEAILHEMAYVPADVLRAPGSERAIDWARDATDRLSALADRGHVEAAYRLAREYMLDHHGIQDLDRAAHYYRMVIARSSPSQIENSISRQNLARICATGRLSMDSSRLCD